jgi:hypothetical protein
MSACQTRATRTYRTRLIDTNIVGNITKPVPSESLLRWMGDQPDDTRFIASLTIAEITRGILELPKGKRCQHFESRLAGPEGPTTLFAGRRIAPRRRMRYGAVSPSSMRRFLGNPSATSACDCRKWSRSSASPSPGLV